MSKAKKSHSPSKGAVSDKEFDAFKKAGKKPMKKSYGGDVMKMKDGGSCGGMRDVGAVKMAMGGSAVAGPSAKKVQGPSNSPCGLYGRK